MKRYSVIILLAVLGFASCKDRSDEFIPGLNSFDTAWVSQIPCAASVHELLDEIQLPIRVDSFNTGQTVILFYTANGGEIAQLRIPATVRWRKLTDSSLVTGKIFVEAKMTNRIGDMLRENLTSNTPSIFFSSLLFKNNGNDVFPIPDSLFNRVELFMRTSVINGLTVSESKGVKDPCQRNLNFSASAPVAPQLWFEGNIAVGYKTTVIGDKKSAVVKPVVLPTGSTRVNVLLPLGFTNTNSKVYVADSSSKKLIALEFDYQNKLFFTNTYNRSQQPKSFLVISKQLQQRFFARADYTTDSIPLLRLNPQPISNNNLILELSRF